MNYCPICNREIENKNGVCERCWHRIENGSIGICAIDNFLWTDKGVCLWYTQKDGWQALRDYSITTLVYVGILGYRQYTWQPFKGVDVVLTTWYRGDVSLDQVRENSLEWEKLVIEIDDKKWELSNPEGDFIPLTWMEALDTSDYGTLNQWYDAFQEVGVTIFPGCPEEAECPSKLVANNLSCWGGRGIPCCPHAKQFTVVLGG